MLEIDPPESWKWSGNGSYVLEPSDRVFGLICPGVPYAFQATANTEITKLGFQIDSYSGLMLPPVGETTSVFKEALADYYAARGLLVILNSAASFDDPNEPALPAIVSAVRRSVPVWMVVLEPSEVQRCYDALPTAARESVELIQALDVQELEERLRQSVVEPSS